MHRKFKFILLAFYLFSSALTLNAKGYNHLFDQIVEKVEENSFYYYDDTRDLLASLYRIADDTSDVVLVAKALYYETQHNSNHGLYDSTLTNTIKKHLGILQVNPKNNLYGIAVAYYALSTNFLIINQYSSSFFNGLQALNAFRELKDSVFLSRTLNLLGKISSQIHSHSMANSYYSEALLYINPSDIYYYKIKSNLLMANSYLQGHPLALSDSIAALVQKSKPLVQDLSELIPNYINLAGLHSSFKNFEISEQYNDTLLSLMGNRENYLLLFKIRFNQGFYHIQKQRVDSALFYYKTALEISQKLSNKTFSSNSLLEIASIYEELECIDSAYHYISQYIALEKNINRNAQVLETTQSFVTSIINSAHREVEVKETEIRLKNRILVGGIILITAIFLVVLMLLVIIKQKKKQQVLLKESMDSKARELISISLILSKKNQLLIEIQNSIKNLPTDIRKCENLDDVSRLLRNSMKTEVDWDSFAVHFEKVHPTFFINLRKYCSELTPNNLRFCAYIRIGLSSKEIATLLNITPTTVKITRSRLRKKLQLSQNISLDTFIASI